MNLKVDEQAQRFVDYENTITNFKKENGKLERDHELQLRLNEDQRLEMREQEWEIKRLNLENGTYRERIELLNKDFVQYNREVADMGLQIKELTAVKAKLSRQLNAQMEQCSDQNERL